MKTILMGCLVASAMLTSCDKDDDDDNDINSTDRNFVMAASMSNHAEIDAGTLASTKATNSGIRAFGMMMTTDHTGAKTELKSLASTWSLYAPDSLDAQHVALKAQLMTLSGRAFDSVYINSQVMDHQRTIELFEDQVDDGDNRSLRDYAEKTLPQLRMHLRHADSLRTNL